MATTTTSITAEEDPIPHTKFLSDLEFLSSLAAPAYLHHLATTPPFVLDSLHFQFYLRYLRDSFGANRDVAKFLKYPQCLEHMRLLINDDMALLNGKIAEAKESKADVQGCSTPFALRMRDVKFRDEVHSQQFSAWRWRVKSVYGGGTNDFDYEPPETFELDALSDDDSSVGSEAMQVGNSAK
jgi:hypothetical protein